MDYKLHFDELRRIFEDNFVKIIQECRDGSRLWEACEYCLTAPGKRVRPVLTLLVGEMLDVPADKLLRFSAAIEFLHNSSLIHDDLPGIDNDDMRRGRPTCHKKFDEGTAILAGDALIALVNKLIYIDNTIGYDSKSHLSKELSDAFYKLCIGQVLDLGSMSVRHVDGASHKGISTAQLLPELEFRHLHKTGALMACCLRGPAVLAGLSAENIEKMGRAGEKIGLLFQITDDILDASAGDKNQKNKDDELGLITYVSLFGVDGSRQYARETTLEIIKLLEPYGVKADNLIAFVKYIESRSV